jgi:hypothetical protein
MKYQSKKKTQSKMHSKRHSKRKTHSKRHTRKTYNRKTYKGGDTTLGSQPFNSFGFENGATSPREAALLHEKNNNAMQHKMNQMSGGRRRSRSRSKRKSRSKHKRKRSGSKSKRTNKQRGGTIEVPTFPPIGGIKQAYSATDLSVGGNTNIVNGLNDAQGDCFATDTCPPTAGGARRKKKSRKL